MLKRYKQNVQIWFEKFFSSLSLYVTLDDEQVKANVIVDMLYVMGLGGKIKYYQNSKLAMLCRMLYRLFDISLK